MPLALRPTTAQFNMQTEKTALNATTIVHRGTGLAARRLGASHCAILARGDIRRGDHRTIRRARDRAGAFHARRGTGSGLYGDLARFFRRYRHLATRDWR